ncbi:MAG: hypothetical protein ACTHJ1_15920 [Bordetella sp.]|uniref:hypothetical protein n=1 Tax=Bordetella sp. TaxID=28081 RepID=UPI003F7B549F
MNSIDFNAVAKTLPTAWRSVVVGQVGRAEIVVEAGQMYLAQAGAESRQRRTALRIQLLHFQ